MNWKITVKILCMFSRWIQNLVHGQENRVPNMGTAGVVSTQQMMLCQSVAGPPFAHVVAAMRPLKCPVIGDRVTSSVCQLRFQNNMTMFHILL